MIDEDYIVETENLVKVYKTGKIKAVDKLNLKIKKKEIYALIGANGSGKSTTINMLTGSLYPTSGSIRVFGENIPKNRKGIARFIGVAPQEYAIYQDLSVYENIEFYGKLYGMSKQDIKQKIDELLGILRILDRKNDLVKNLSGGMKRRVSLACSLIHSPKLVFFDEATVGVDPVLRSFFWEYFRSLRDSGSTIIVTSHVMDEAEKADRIGLMRAGKLIDEGTPTELKENYKVGSIEEVFLKVSDGVVIDG